MKLLLLTYNIHKCIGGLDREYRPERVAEVVASCRPDVALLQEVDEGARRTDLHRQVDWLGDRLGYRHRTFFRNVHLRSGGGYGNAILSRYPITETRNIDLRIGPLRTRSALHARLRARRRTIHLFNLHLGLIGLERRAQLRRFLDSEPFRGLHPRTPVVVAGDFNDARRRLGRLYLRPAGFRGMTQTIRTFPAWAPLRGLDAVYVRGDVELVSVRRVPTDISRRASDHLPLLAELSLR